MADNISLPHSAGLVLATNEIDGVQVLRFKLQSGADGAAQDVSDDAPLPVHVMVPGLSVFRAVGLTTTGQVAKDAPARLFGWYLANSGATGAFVKLFDSASAPTVGTDAPIATLFVPPGAAISSEHPNGVAFAHGIAVAATVAAADSDATAPAAGTVSIDLFYADAGAVEAPGEMDPAMLGVVLPSPSTIAKRDGAGMLLAAGFDAQGARVVEVGTPTLATDAATKGYVDTIVANVAVRPPVAIAGLASASTSSFTVVGRFQLDASAFPPGTSFAFQAILEATPGQTAELRLYNVTDAGAISGSTLSTSNATPTLVSVSVSLPAGSKMYEAQLRLSSAPAAADRATCTRAEITT